MGLGQVRAEGDAGPGCTAGPHAATMARMLDFDLWTGLLLAPGLGIAMTALLWPLRRGRQGRRTIYAIWLAVLAVVAALLVQRLALPMVLRPPAEPRAALSWKLAEAVWRMLAFHAGLQVLDLVIWEGLLVRLADRPVPRLLINVFNVLALMVAVLAIAHSPAVFGLSLSTLVVSSTVVSAVVGLALQDVLRSMVAGIVLQIESPMSLGDWVSIGGHEGRVMQMNWRTVTLRTRENRHVVLTNGKVSAEDIINFSQPMSLQGVDCFIGVAYPHPPEQVKAVLREALADAPGLRQVPPPRIFTVSYDDFAITYRIRFWINDYGTLREVQDAVMTRVWYALKRAGMSIPFPIRDVNLRAVPEDAAEREAEARRARVLRALRPLPFLAPLDDAQLAQVAAGARLQRFAVSECLMREGEAGDSLFVLCAGEAQVQVTGTDGNPVTVALRRAGDFLGEMSLLTGAPRSATVRCDSEVEAVIVDKAAFREILLADPRIAERLSENLAAREMEQADRVAEAGARLRVQRSVRDEILGRIRSFFAMGEGTGELG